MHTFLKIAILQDEGGKILRKWLEIVISKNQESIRMTHLRWLNNNMGCIEMQSVMSWLSFLKS